ncbi:MAG: VWA domain-containing protein, partial [Actinobacteria bacterium]|nr:VWA domain-containing protein [Actinomycetota bacterium]
APQAAEVILVDCSSSMAWPPTKIAAARRATAAAIDTLRDGVFFAVVEGTSRARMVYPPAPPLTAVTPQTRAEAKAAAARLIASGGTAIGTWLTQARELLDDHPTAIRHALLLTDGKNETESREQLERVLDACAGRFVCDARGIGEGWEPRELLRIVSALRGAADAVREDSDLEADFRAMMQAAMRKVVPNLRIRIRLVPGNRLRFIKQVFPTELDLTEHGVEINAYTQEFSTGSWAEENREYHVCIEVAPDGPMFEEVQLAQVELAAVTDRTDVDAPGRPMPIVVHRTDDPVLSTRLDPKVDHYTIQEELGRSMMAGCDAYDAGDLETARAEWGHAVELATAAGNEERLTRLKRLVDIDP